MSEWSVQLYKPLYGVATGALATTLERLRQTQMADDAYTKEYVYAISIHNEINLHATDSGQESIGNHVFIFPVAPSEMSVQRTFRQSVTATLGGIVAEEAGLAFKDITVGGSFGLQAKNGWDSSFTTLQEDYSIVQTGPYSGPHWTNRMLRNFFDEYGKAKASDYGATTYMVWHNFKDDEHYRVVPQTVSLNRTVGSRGQYPFRIVFRAIADDDACTLIPSSTSLLSAAIGAVTGAIGAMSDALEVVASTVQTMSNALGEVRNVVATVDSVLDDITRIVSALSDFLESGKRTVEMGSAFISSTTALLEEVADFIELAPTLSPDIKATYRDSLDALYSTTITLLGLENDDYDTTAAGFADNETSAGTSSNNYSTARSFTPVENATEHSLSATDTLQSLALQHLGDGALWYELAALNGLVAPYISVTGGPSVLKVGDTILLPAPRRSTRSLGSGHNAAALFGSDIRVVETPLSVAGRAQVDIELDSQLTDLKLIEGTDNLAQAVQLRIWTAMGTYVFDGSYGLPQAIGLGQTQGVATSLKLAVRAAMKADSRIVKISALTVIVSDDAVDIDANLIPIGYTGGVVSISAAVV